MTSETHKDSLYDKKDQKRSSRPKILKLTEVPVSYRNKKRIKVKVKERSQSNLRSGIYDDPAYTDDISHLALPIRRNSGPDKIENTHANKDVPHLLKLADSYNTTATTNTQFRSNSSSSDDNLPLNTIEQHVRGQSLERPTIRDRMTKKQIKHERLLKQKINFNLGTNHSNTTLKQQDKSCIPIKTNNTERQKYKLKSISGTKQSTSTSEVWGSCLAAATTTDFPSDKIQLNKEEAHSSAKKMTKMQVGKRFLKGEIGIKSFNYYLLREGLETTKNITDKKQQSSLSKNDPKPFHSKSEENIYEEIFFTDKNPDILDKEEKYSDCEICTQQCTEENCEYCLEDIKNRHYFGSLGRNQSSNSDMSTTQILQYQSYNPNNPGIFKIETTPVTFTSDYNPIHQLQIENVSQSQKPQRRDYRIDNQIPNTTASQINRKSSSSNDSLHHKKHGKHRNLQELFEYNQNIKTDCEPSNLNIYKSDSKISIISEYSAKSESSLKNFRNDEVSDSSLGDSMFSYSTQKRYFGSSESCKFAFECRRCSLDTDRCNFSDTCKYECRNCDCSSSYFSSDFDDINCSKKSSTGLSDNSLKSHEYYNNDKGKEMKKNYHGHDIKRNKQTELQQQQQQQKQQHFPIQTSGDSSYGKIFSKQTEKKTSTSHYQQQLRQYHLQQKSLCPGNKSLQQQQTHTQNSPVTITFSHDRRTKPKIIQITSLDNGNLTETPKKEIKNKDSNDEKNNKSDRSDQEEITDQKQFSNYQYPKYQFLEGGLEKSNTTRSPVNPYNSPTFSKQIPCTSESDRRESTGSETKTKCSKNSSKTDKIRQELMGENQNDKNNSLSSQTNTKVKYTKDADSNLKNPSMIMKWTDYEDDDDDDVFIIENIPESCNVSGKKNQNQQKTMLENSTTKECNSKSKNKQTESVIKIENETLKDKDTGSPCSIESSKKSSTNIRTRKSKTQQNKQLPIISDVIPGTNSSEKMNQNSEKHKNNPSSSENYGETDEYELVLIEKCRFMNNDDQLINKMNPSAGETDTTTCSISSLEMLDIAGKSQTSMSSISNLELQREPKPAKSGKRIDNLNSPKINIQSSKEQQSFTVNRIEISDLPLPELPQKRRLSKSRQSNKNFTRNYNEIENPQYIGIKRVQCPDGNNSSKNFELRKMQYNSLERKIKTTVEPNCYYGEDSGDDNGSSRFKNKRSTNTDEIYLNKSGWVQVNSKNPENKNTNQQTDNRKCNNQKNNKNKTIYATPKIYKSKAEKPKINDESGNLVISQGCLKPGFKIIDPETASILNERPGFLPVKTFFDNDFPPPITPILSPPPAFQDSKIKYKNLTASSQIKSALNTMKYDQISAKGMVFSRSFEYDRKSVDYVDTFSRSFDCNLTDEKPKYIEKKSVVSNFSKLTGSSPNYLIKNDAGGIPRSRENSPKYQYNKQFQRSKTEKLYSEPRKFATLNRTDEKPSRRTPFSRINSNLMGCDAKLKMSDTNISQRLNSCDSGARSDLSNDEFDNDDDDDDDGNVNISHQLLSTNLMFKSHSLNHDKSDLYGSQNSLRKQKSFTSDSRSLTPEERRRKLSQISPNYWYNPGSHSNTLERKPKFGDRSITLSRSSSSSSSCFSGRDCQNAIPTRRPGHKNSTSFNEYKIRRSRSLQLTERSPSRIDPSHKMINKTFTAYQHQSVKGYPSFMRQNQIFNELTSKHAILRQSDIDKSQSFDLDCNAYRSNYDVIEFSSFDKSRSFDGGGYGGQMKNIRYPTSKRDISKLSGSSYQRTNEISHQTSPQNCGTRLCDHNLTYDKLRRTFDRSPIMNFSQDYDVPKPIKSVMSSNSSELNFLDEHSPSYDYGRNRKNQSPNKF